MIMRKSYLLAAMAFMLVSCSQDETIEVNRENDVIQFGLVTDASTRAADVFCNNNKPDEFTVYADYNGKSYIDADVIKSQNNKWENTSGVRYWPEGQVTFYAHVNSDSKFTGTDFTSTPNVAPQITAYTVPTTVADQKDLLYAVKTQSKGQVTLNFRHALSQIVFQAKNTNKNLYVEIDGVTICNLVNVNTFTYPTADTDDNIINYDGNGKKTTTGAWGTWADLITVGNTNYPVSFTTVSVPGDGAVKSLTNTNDTNKEFSSNAMLLLPQTTTAWAPSATSADPDADTQTGSYFLVKCSIYNVAGTAVDETTDVCLWGGTETKNVAIPASFAWEQGKKYIYTFVFGDGNGGYNPDPDPTDPDPKPEPVLVPITFDVTVDDFVPVTQPETPMQTK